MKLNPVPLQNRFCPLINPARRFTSIRWKLIQSQRWVKLSLSRVLLNAPMIGPAFALMWHLDVTSQMCRDCSARKELKKGSRRRVGRRRTEVTTQRVSRRVFYSAIIPREMSADHPLNDDRYDPQPPPLRPPNSHSNEFLHYYCLQLTVGMRR